MAHACHCPAKHASVTRHPGQCCFTFFILIPTPLAKMWSNLDCITKVTGILLTFIKYKILILNSLFQTKHMLHAENSNPPILTRGLGGCGSLALATLFFLRTATLLNEVQALSWHTEPRGPLSVCPRPPGLSLVLWGYFQDLEGTRLVPPCGWSMLVSPGALFPLCLLLSALIVLSQKPSPHTLVP